jgi:hypothetical protein
MRNFPLFGSPPYNNGAIFGLTKSVASIHKICEACLAANIAPGLGCAPGMQSWTDYGYWSLKAQPRVSRKEMKDACAICDEPTCSQNISGYQQPQMIVSEPVTTKTKVECKPEMSLHQLCLDMIHKSSPPGSPSFHKLLHILQRSQYYELNIKEKIFWDVSNNIVKMLKSWGLHEHKAFNHGGGYKLRIDPTEILHVETVVSTPSICNVTTASCDAIPRVLIQTEQLYAIGKQYVPRLEACHQSPLCIIWDFSDFHLDWWKMHGMTDSLMTLPIMIQKRLGDNNGVATPLQNRSMDIVFFGAMTERRAHLVESFKRNTPNLVLEYSQTLNTKVMKKKYANAKVCLIVHAYMNVSAGETHRLSELARFGCIPVVETWGDKSYLDYYAGCGDVIFSDFDNLINTTIEVLAGINNYPTTEVQYSLKKRLKWWQDDIQWASVLTSLFDGFSRTEDKEITH